MPTSPYAKVLVSVNSGASSSGGITVPAGATIAITGENTSQWTLGQRWEIYDYPVGFTAPSGWSTDSNGVIFSTAVIPTLFTLGSAAARWGKYMIRLTVNGGLTNGLPDATLIDEATALSMLSPNGLRDLAFKETSQFGGPRSQWASELRAILRTIDGNLAGTALAAGVATWLGAPSSANLLAAMTTSTGTGSLVFHNTPILTTPQINNPTGTFQYRIVVSALTGNVSIILPLLTAGSDTFVFQSFGQPLTNKTVDVTLNTLTGTGAALGDILWWNGTKFVSLPRGTNGQVLTATTTSIAWASGGGGSPGGTTGQIQYNNAGAFGGATNVLTGSGFISIGATPSTVGALRLANNVFVFAKDIGATDRQVIGIDASSYLQVGNGMIQSQYGGDDTIVGTSAGQIFRGGTAAVNFSVGKLTLTDSTAFVTDLTRIEKYLTADFVNASATLTSCNLSFPIAANETWVVEWDGQATAPSGTTGMNFAVTAPSGCTIKGDLFASTSAITSFITAPITSTSGTATYLNSASQVGKVRMRCTFINGATAGTIALQTGSPGAVSCKLNAGFAMTARRSAGV